MKEYRYPAWPRRDLSGFAHPDQAFLDWTQVAVLGEQNPSLNPEASDPAECSCLDRSQAELVELLEALDNYNIVR